MTARVSEDHFWFGPSARPLAGVLHTPLSETARDIGVVICKPFGVDLLCTHRAHRRLAIELAAAGVPSLRFDYDGTGDSAGDDDDKGRLEAWLESIGRAVEELRARAFVDRVCLVGAGFGALLAAAFARRGGIDSLALFGPPASGRAWLRQARAFQLLRAPKGASAPIGGVCEELVGFRLTPETLEALMALEPVAPGAPGPRAALIVPRDDLPGHEERFAQGLRAMGSEVTVTAAPGFGAMMRDDPYTSVVPDEAWRTIVSWLVARSRGAAGAAGSPPSRISALLEAHAGEEPVRETFLAPGGLFGVVTEPPAGMTPSTSIFLLTIGANPHYGVNRMYVEMARAWAKEGFRVVRLDVAGIGDTPAAPGDRENVVYAPSVVRDVRNAMDADAKASGTMHFILVGLCSGAYTAFYAAAADPRVTGLVLINPLTFHWREGDSLEVRVRQSVKSTRFYARSALEWSHWPRLLRGEVHVRALATQFALRAMHASVHAIRVGDVERSFRALDSRGTSVLLVFGIEDGGIDVIEAHLGGDARRMRHAKHFSMVVLDGPDHTFTSPHWQRHLSGLLSRHFAHCIGHTHRPSGSSSPR
jgi:alpha-beta hydrolase superfamily lysophospholipase